MCLVMRVGGIAVAGLLDVGCIDSLLVLAGLLLCLLDLDLEFVT